MIKLDPLFAYELLAVCQAFIDDQGCLHEDIDYKPGLVISPDILNSSWPHDGSHYNLVASIGEYLITIQVLLAF